MLEAPRAVKVETPLNGICPVDQCYIHTPLASLTFPFCGISVQNHIFLFCLFVVLASPFTFKQLVYLLLHCVILYSALCYKTFTIAFLLILYFFKILILICEDLFASKIVSNIFQPFLSFISLSLSALCVF